jgi:hypothetical protein
MTKLEARNPWFGRHSDSDLRNPCDVSRPDCLGGGKPEILPTGAILHNRNSPAVAAAPRIAYPTGRTIERPR